MNTEEKRIWHCICGNPIIECKVHYPQDIKVDVQFELYPVVCPRCRKVPQLVERDVDRKPKLPSRIILPQQPQKLQ
jgi:hypothetical protein